MSNSQQRRVFSGIQPSGNLHLGNYLGAIRRWVDGQGEKENFICVVDLHAVTVYQDPEELRDQTRKLMAFLLASGIDPRGGTTLFVQSHVRAHAEGAWLLNCVTPVGWLERMTQYKMKAAQQESVLTGLMTYPVLQAADILLYSAHEVPVGEDQKQHIELARDVAQRFNHLYGDTLVVPEPSIAEAGARIMALDDPTAKMSKSIEGQYHAIRLADDDETSGLIELIGQNRAPGAAQPQPAAPARAVFEFADLDRVLEIGDLRRRRRGADENQQERESGEHAA